MRGSDIFVALLLAIPLVLAPGGARACSVCEPGDPLFSKEGSTAQPYGRLFFAIETSVSSKESGALAHAHGALEEGEHHEAGEHEEEDEHEGRAAAGGGDREESFTREMVFYTAWTPIERLTLSASLPYRWIVIEEKPAGEASHSTREQGVGDASLYSTLVLWRNRDTLPTSWVEGRLMLKLPTGEDHSAEGGVIDPHLQLGTGSWDWGVGLAGNQQIGPGQAYASAFLRLNQEGANDYEYGDVFLANLAYTVDGHTLGVDEGRGLRGGMELNLRYARRDVSEGSHYRDSGGHILYATPFLGFKLGPHGADGWPTLRVSVRLPLGEGGLNGDQDEDPVYLMSLGIGF